MNVYKRPHSRFYWFNTTVDGKRKRISTKRELKKEAEKIALEYEKRQLDIVQLGSKPVGDFNDAYDKYIKANKRRLADIDNIEDRYNRFKEWFPDTKTTDVTDRLIKAYVEKLQERGLAHSSMNLAIGDLRRAYQYASVDYAMGDVQKFPRFKTTSKMRYLLEGEEARLLSELNPKRVTQVSTVMKRQLQDQYDLAVFLLDTGARCMEISTIGWDAIDTINWRWINIYRSKVGNEGVLAMTDRLREILQRRRMTTNSPFVFPSKHDIRVPRGYAVKGIRAAIDRAGLNKPHLVTRYGKFTPHSFRDTFATKLVKAGVSLYKVQKLLGHSTPAMTAKYAQLTPSDAADEAASVLNQLVHKNTPIANAPTVPDELAPSLLL